MCIKSEPTDRRQPYDLIFQYKIQRLCFDPHFASTEHFLLLVENGFPKFCIALRKRTKWSQVNRVHQH